MTSELEKELNSNKKGSGMSYAALCLAVNIEKEVKRLRDNKTEADKEQELKNFVETL